MKPLIVDNQEEISERMQAFSNLCATSWDFPFFPLCLLHPIFEKMFHQISEISRPIFPHIGT